MKLRLYPGEDDDLIAFFGAILPQLRATMVKRALRSGTREGAATLGTSDQVFDMLESLVG